mmetsp:Transcript_111793/g.316511  ORF Transcript_111793/g.316511 Transcript_111793/m.316511 type:complete len:325 (-) Transcript_111793:444-1418(-)
MRISDSSACTRPSASSLHCFSTSSFCSARSRCCSAHLRCSCASPSWPSVACSCSCMSWVILCQVCSIVACMSGWLRAEAGWLRAEAASLSQVCQQELCDASIDRHLFLNFEISARSSLHCFCDETRRACRASRSSRTSWSWLMEFTGVRSFPDPLARSSFESSLDDVCSASSRGGSSRCSGAPCCCLHCLHLCCLELAFCKSSTCCSRVRSRSFFASSLSPRSTSLVVICFSFSASWSPRSRSSSSCPWRSFARSRRRCTSDLACFTICSASSRARLDASACACLSRSLDSSVAAHISRCFSPAASTVSSSFARRFVSRCAWAA